MEWSRPHAIEFAAALGLGLFGLLLLARRAARSRDARSLTLVALRASALIVLVLILLDPVATTESRQPGEKPTAILLVDGSRSMGLERPTSRIDRAAAEIAEGLAAVPVDRMPGVDRYRFGRTLSAVSPSEPLRATDDESRLLDALERLPSRFGPTPPVGVFVFSDGRATESKSKGLAEVAAAYRKLGVPIHVRPLGDPAVSGDVSIRDLSFPREVAKGTRFPVKLVVGSRGFEGQRVEVAIRPAGGPDSRPLARLPMTLAGGEQPAELVIEADRARSGLVAEVTSLPGESVAENNRVPFRVGGRDRKIRVIYMEGSADPEYAFIRDALVEDPNIECLALSVDLQNSIKPQLHRVDDPSRGYPDTREELLGYDVVICSDIARAAFTPQQIEWTVELVSRRGGGFAMVGGHTSFGSGGWDRTPWDGMIPIDMSGDGPGRASQFYDGEFRVVVPPEAEAHPIWRIADDPARNRAILDRMPPFYGTNLTDRLKPAATVLGVADRSLTGVAAPPSRRPGGTPIFSAQPYGRGRSFAMSTDSTIAWGSAFEHYWGEGDNRYFRKFWRNVVTWLAENSSGTSRLLEVAIDRVIYRPGQPVEVSARAFDEAFRATDRYRLVARLVSSSSLASNEPPPPLVSDMPMAARAESVDFAAALAIPQAESIRSADGSGVRAATVEVVAFEGERQVAKSSLDVQVLDDSDEFRDPRPDPRLLANLASASGGTVLADAADLARHLEQSTKGVDRVVTTRSPLWDSPVVLGVLFALLALEWVVRRLKGLA